MHSLVEIETTRITDWDSFHTVCAETLGFPEFYGRNMNAWVDCMTSLDAPADGLTRVHAPSGGVLVLALSDATDFAVRCPEIFDALVEWSAFVNYRKLDVGEPPVLALSFWKRTPTAIQRLTNAAGGSRGLPEQVKALIASAFAGTEYPGDWCLTSSLEGCEPGRVEEAFRGKIDWRTLDPGFIDSVSALSFFSDEAFRFYLPAFLLADIDGKLERADPVFSLIHGLDDESRGERVNPRRYGERTWFDEKRCKFAMFSVEQARAIVAYLQLISDRDEVARPSIEQALTNYWTQRSNTDLRVPGADDRTLTGGSD